MFLTTDRQLGSWHWRPYTKHPALGQTKPRSNKWDLPMPGILEEDQKEQ